MFSQDGKTDARLEIRGCRVARLLLAFRIQRAQTHDLTIFGRISR